MNCFQLLTEATAVDWKTFIADILIFLTALIGVWQSVINRGEIKKGVVVTKDNSAKIDDLHKTVNSQLADAKAETAQASERLLAESTSAALARGVLQGKQSEQENPTLGDLKL
jgi:hypothetical protein